MLTLWILIKALTSLHNSYNCSSQLSTSVISEKEYICVNCCLFVDISICNNTDSIKFSK